MKHVFYGGLEYVQIEGEKLNANSFFWGDNEVNPGMQFEKIGSKQRTSIDLKDASLEYCGRIDKELFFSIIADYRNSKDENWYICASFVNDFTLLIQSSHNSFWDVKF